MPPSPSRSSPFPSASKTPPPPGTGTAPPPIRISHTHHSHSRTPSSSSSRSAASFYASHAPPLSPTAAAHHQHQHQHQHHKSHARRPSLADAVLDARRGAGARLKRAANKLKRWGTGSGGMRRRGRGSSMSSGASSTNEARGGAAAGGRAAQDERVPAGVEEDWIEDEEEEEEDEYSDLSPFDEDDDDDDDRGDQDEGDDSDGWSASVHSSRQGSADMDLPWTPRGLRGPPARRQPPAKPTRSATAPPLGSLPTRHPNEGSPSGSLPSLASSLPMHPLSQVRNSTKSPASPRFTASPPMIHSPPPNDVQGRPGQFPVEDEDHRSPTANQHPAGFPILPTTAARSPDAAPHSSASHDTRTTHLTSFSHTNPADTWLPPTPHAHGHRHLARRWLFARTSLVTRATLGYAVVDVSALGIDIAHVPPALEQVAATAFEGLIVDDDELAGVAPVVVSDGADGASASAAASLVAGSVSGPAAELQFTRLGELSDVAVLDIGRLAAGIKRGCKAGVSDLTVQLVAESSAAPAPAIMLVAPHLRAKDLFVQYVGFLKLERERPLMTRVDGEVDDGEDDDDEFLADAYHALKDLISAEHDVARRYQQAQETLADHQSTLTALTTHLSDLHLAASGLVTDAQGECRALPGSLAADLDAHATAVDAHQAHFVARVRNRAKVLAAYQVQAVAALELAERAKGKGKRGKVAGDKGAWIARVAVGLVVVVAVVRAVNPWGVFSLGSVTAVVEAGEASRPVPPGAWQPAPAPPGHVGPPPTSVHPSRLSGEAEKVVTIVREIYYSAAPIAVQAVAVATPAPGNGNEAGARDGRHDDRKEWWWERMW